MSDFNFFSFADTLKRTNATMRQQYSMVNNWQNSVKDLKENHETELNKFRNINDEVSFIFNLYYMKIIENGCLSL